MKGQTFQIEELLKLFAVIIVFLGAVLIIISATGGMVSVFESFCQHNPSWCGDLPECPCCLTTIHTKMGFPFKDIYSEEYIWTNRNNCVELMEFTDGNMFYTDPERSRCGNSPNKFIVGDTFEQGCVVPDQYVSDSMPDCVCCMYEADPGIFFFQWDMNWKCAERTNYTIIDNDGCGPLYLLPKEAQEQIFIRTNKLFGIGGQYCEIPFPYNQTEAP